MRSNLPGCAQGLPTLPACALHLTLTCSGQPPLGYPSCMQGVLRGCLRYLRLAPHADTCFFFRSSLIHVWVSLHPSHPSRVKGDPRWTPTHVPTCHLSIINTSPPSGHGTASTHHKQPPPRTVNGSSRPSWIMWPATAASMGLRLSWAYGRPTCMKPSCMRKDMRDCRSAAPPPPAHAVNGTP